MDQNLAKKFRIMTLGLIFSGALNIGLLATCFIKQDRIPMASTRALHSSLEEPASSNKTILNGMAALSFRELVALLTNRELVEEGYTKRDLALSALVAFRHFNLEKALGTELLQKRTVLIQAGTVELYPGLGEEQFEAIIRFAYKEKWPLTSKGLFELLQKMPSSREESLCQAFSLTSEFCALQLLFQKTEAPQTVLTLIDLATEGGWDLLCGFTKEQAQLLDLSLEKRRRFLLSSLAQRSKTAAKLLLQTDFEFVLKRLDDPGICDMIALLEESFEEANKFCAALLVSARSDSVRKSAAEKLYALARLSLTSPVTVSSAIAQFCPTHKEEVRKEVAPPSTPAPTPAPTVKNVRYHTVADGETLWKIARQYKVKVEDLVHINDIEQGRLYPGMTLQIP